MSPRNDRKSFMEAATRAARLWTCGVMHCHERFLQQHTYSGGGSQSLADLVTACWSTRNDAEFWPRLDRRFLGFCCGTSLEIVGSQSEPATMNDTEDPQETFLSETTRPLVLVVDDDAAVREALCDLLDEAGFAAVAARHGLEALKVLASLQTIPAFILLDLTMPTVSSG